MTLAGGFATTDGAACNSEPDLAGNCTDQHHTFACLGCVRVEEMILLEPIFPITSRGAAKALVAGTSCHCVVAFSEKMLGHNVRRLANAVVLSFYWVAMLFLHIASSTPLNDHLSGMLLCSMDESTLVQ
jgi:hypothetical protein